MDLGLGRVQGSRALTTAHGDAHGLSKVLAWHLQMVLLENLSFLLVTGASGVAPGWIRDEVAVGDCSSEHQGKLNY